MTLAAPAPKGPWRRIARSALTAILQALQAARTLFRTHPSAFPWILRGSALAGLWCSGALYFAVLHECVHSLGHEPHRLSLLGQALDDFTPLPGLLALLSTAAFLGFCISADIGASRTSVSDEDRGPWLAMTSILGLWSVLAWVLLESDITYIPAWADLWHDPYRVVVGGLGAGILLSASGVLLLAFRLRLAGAVLHCWSPLAVTFLILYSSAPMLDWQFWALPPIFPTPEWVLLALATAAVLHLILPRLLCEGVVSNRMGSRIAISWGIWNWSVAAAAGLGYLMPFHHMCLHGGNERIQWGVATAFILAFVACCAPLWTIAFRRWRMSGQTFSGRNPSGTVA